MSTPAEARSAADAAAVAAGVAIAPVSAPDELDVLRATMESVWGPEIVPPRSTKAAPAGTVVPSFFS